jgi:hypothetical protein
MFIKKIWFTTRDGLDLKSISFESKNSLLPISASELKFKDRHTINIGLFDQDDINLIAQFFDTIRSDI